MLLFRKTLSPHRSHSPLRTSFTSSIYRFLSSPPPSQDAPAPAPSAHASPNPNFAAQYLINSCGLPSERAARVSRYLPHLKSPEKPDSVLRFLRRAGVAEAHIKAAALRQPGFLCYSIENCFKPRMAELRELGFSQSDISLLLSISPVAFTYTKLQHKVRFWLGFFGSVEKLLCVSKRSFRLVSADLENTVMPNLAFLREQCGLPPRRISQLVNTFSSTITSKPDVFKMHVKRAQELGVSSSSGMFVYALGVVAKLNKDTIDARMCHLRSYGFSEEEVTLLISKYPSLLRLTTILMSQKMEFLLKKADCAKIDVLANPAMLTLSLEKRLVPRSLVRNLLKSKGVATANSGFMKFVNLNEKQFLEKFVLPYEEIVPGLLQAYTNACGRQSTATDRVVES